MSQISSFSQGIRVQKGVITDNIYCSNPFVGNKDVKPADPLDAEKLEHQFAITHRQATGTAVVAKTEDVHAVYGAAGVIAAVQVIATTAPSGDHTITVDVQVGSQSVGFATVLTGVVTVDSTIAAKQVVNGTLVASPNLVAGNIIRVIVAVSGSTGSQGQGLLVSVITREDPL